MTANNSPTYEARGPEMLWLPATALRPSAVSTTFNASVLSIAATAVDPVSEVAQLPAPIAAATSSQAPTPSSIVLPSEQVAQAAVQAPVVSTGNNVTISPSALSVASVVNAPLVEVYVSPAVESIQSSVQAPTITTTGDKTVMPSVVSVASNTVVPAPSVDVAAPGQSVASSAVAPTPTIGQLPATQIAVSSVGSPSLMFDQTLMPSVITLAASIPAPLVIASGSSAGLNPYRTTAITGRAGEASIAGRQRVASVSSSSRSVEVIRGT